MEHYDRLFVINQDVPLDALAAFGRGEGENSAVLLSTHQLFPNERELFCSRWKGRVEILTFADLLTEEELCCCDETARASLLAGGARDGYNARFMASSLAEKNRLAHLKLTSMYRFGNIYFARGLGVDGTFWEKVGTVLALHGSTAGITPPGRAPGALLRLAAMARRLLRREKREVSVIVEGDTSYVFFSPLKRLRIKGGVTVLTRSVPRTMEAAALRKALLAVVERGTRGVPCMTVHGYDEALARALGGVLVFVDGYHPANYPPAYLDGYAEGDRFIPRAMYDARWFTDHGRAISAPPAFLEREFFASCLVTRASRVLVAMNHAGDWTSLISRCDTDRLVAGVVELARFLPRLTFRLRLHPTMDHPAHEGAQASGRVACFVRGAGVQNLHLSGSSLSEDLDWCELCVSEYSQVLLDAWRLGKLGVALNLTRRRSFMQDYADLGFFHGYSVADGYNLLRYLEAEPLAAARQQNEAVRRYNSSMAAWLAALVSYRKGDSGEG